MPILRSYPASVEPALVRVAFRAAFSFVFQVPAAQGMAGVAYPGTVFSKDAPVEGDLFHAKGRPESPPDVSGIPRAMNPVACQAVKPLVRVLGVTVVAQSVVLRGYPEIRFRKRHVDRISL